ncbi:MAG: hydantoinase/oxoprolinase family protein [Pirellulales bacterium]
MTDLSKHLEVVGIDIGGANIKVSRLDGLSASCQFPMWTDYRRLGSAIDELLKHLNINFSENTCLALTMTGEMADCFNSRREGVAAILDGVTSVIPSQRIWIYAVGGEWLRVEQAKQNSWQVAASNWHALVSWLLLQDEWQVKNCDLVLDIGSTTVDIIPLRHGQIATGAKTDRQRMQLGQLVYTGAGTHCHSGNGARIASGGETCPVIAEKFTSLDLHLILHTVAEDPQNCDTADGKPRSRHFALARLARMVGEDTETIGEHEVVSLANQILEAQAVQIIKALLRNLPSNTDRNRNGNRQIFVSGHGRPIIERMQVKSELADVNWLMLDELVSPLASRCAPALAVAQLLQKQLIKQFNGWTS